MAYELAAKRQNSLAVTGNTTVSIPAGYMIQSIIIQETAGNAVTGGIKIGTTNGGVDVVASLAILANALFAIPDATLLKRVFSLSSDTTLYVQTLSLWSSASVDFHFVLQKVI